MTPLELRRTSLIIRNRYSPPDVAMRPGEYVSHEAMHVLAEALDELAANVELDEPRAVAAPGPDDAYLRAHALELAVKAGLGFGGADDLARATATLVAYLRDGVTQPDPHLGTAKGADAPAPGPGRPGAPAALHEAIDRAWVSIRDEGDLQAMDSDEDEDVLEQLRTLGDAEIARTGFTLAIVRALGQSVRADRHQATALQREAEAER